jgi:hypothetical protein
MSVGTARTCFARLNAKAFRAGMACRPVCPAAPSGAELGATATPQRSAPTGGDGGDPTPAHPASRDSASKAKSIA